MVAANALEAVQVKESWAQYDKFGWRRRINRQFRSAVRDYRSKDDDRHFLYRAYCRVLNELSPAVFVMENVKGMLTGLPRLRSGLSRRDDEHVWYDAVVDAMETVGKIIRNYPGQNFGGFLDELDRVVPRTPQIVPPST